jgi:hypothetical protein
MARVARGLVLVEDTLYEDDTFEEAERLAIRRMSLLLRGGVARALRGRRADRREVRILEKRRPVDSWLDRVGSTGEEAARVRALIGDHIVDGQLVDHKILLKGRK